VKIRFESSFINLPNFGVGQVHESFAKFRLARSQLYALFFKHETMSFELIYFDSKAPQH